MIKLENVTVKYNDKTVISNLTFEFKDGFNAILGKSGSGKTTLANAILSLKEYEGRITSDHTKYAAVFQEDRLIENLSVKKNLSLFCKDNTLIEEGLNSLLLSDSANKKALELSGGMKRRVALLRALLSDYEVLILDEPFKGLDKATKNITMNYIKEKTSGKIVILITHDLSEVEFFNCNSLFIKL